MNWQVLIYLSQLHKDKIFIVSLSMVHFTCIYILMCIRYFCLITVSHFSWFFFFQSNYWAFHWGHTLWCTRSQFICMNFHSHSNPVMVTLHRYENWGREISSSNWLTLYGYQMEFTFKRGQSGPTVHELKLHVYFMLFYVKMLINHCPFISID